MAFCTTCGADLDSDVKFCNACGTTIQPRGMNARAVGTKRVSQMKTFEQSITLWLRN